MRGREERKKQQDKVNGRKEIGNEIEREKEREKNQIQAVN